MKSRNKLIVVVDDERIITNPLKRLISRALREKKQIQLYQLSTYNDPKEALEELRQLREDRTDLALVISDIMMPQMNGLDFLLRVRDLYPFAPRIILTGYGDKENAIRAINDLELYQYIEKPWDDNHIKKLVANALEKYRLETMFQKYVPDEIIKQLIDQGDEDILKGQDYKATILFLDIVDFTERTEKMKPAEMVDLLNQYFTAMIEVIHRRQGTLDKFTGDGLMALFGVPKSAGGSLEADAKNAVRAAMEIVDVVAKLNRELKVEPIRIRIGLNTGEVVAGNIGSVERLNYTAIGDAVNTASRIEDLARDFLGPDDPACILTSKATYEQIQSGLNGEIKYKEHGMVELRGKRNNVFLYQIMLPH